MKPIKFKWGPYLGYDHSGNPRWYGIIPNGKKLYRSRLVMSNFLHCANLPKVFSVHHKKDTEIDEISNLQLMSMVGHGKLHEPYNYDRYGVSSSENPAAYQRARYADPLIKEARLVKRREYYQNNLKNDLDYIQKNRERVTKYHLLTRKRKEDKFENRNL